MKNNRKDPKKIISLLVVSIVILSLFFFLHKSTDNKININTKNENTNKTEELDKNNEKTSEDNGTTVKNELGNNQTSAPNKDAKEQDKDKPTKVINNQEGITVFVKAANFGSTVELLMDRSKFNSSYKYYQFSFENKSISNIESITKGETTIFPAQEVGSEVVLNLLDENNKVLKELKIKLAEKK